MAALAAATLPWLPHRALWPVAALCYVPPLLFVGLGLVLVVVSGSNFAARLLALAALAVSLCLVDFGWTWGGRGGLRVISLNMGSWSASISRAAEALYARRPDVLMLQEVWGQEHVAWLVAHFPGWCVARPRTEMDQLIVSRYPLSRVRLLSHSTRSLLLASLRLPSGSLTLVDIHDANARKLDPLPWPDAAWRLHRRQMAELSHTLAGLRRPIVLAGDFNTPALSPWLRKPPGGLVDAFARAGQGYGASFPASFPLWRIDFVMASPQLHPVVCRTIGIPGCDHRAVEADFIVPWQQGRQSRSGN